MKKKIILIIFWALLTVSFTAYVSAGVITNKTQIAEMQAELNAYDYDVYTKKVRETEEQISGLQENLVQAEQEKNAAEQNEDPLGVLRAESMINSYADEIRELSLTLAETTLQMDLNYYYMKNKDAIVAKEKAQLTYSSYSDCLKAKLYDYHLAYLDALEKEHEDKLNMEKSKQKLGYTTQLAVDEATMQLESVKLQIETAKAEQGFLVESLSLNGIENIEINVPTEVQALKDDYVAQFLASSTKTAYFDSQITAYQNYRTDLENTAVTKANLEVQIVTLKKQQYQIDLELYVKQLILKYETTNRNILSIDNQIFVLQSKIKNNELLYQKGKITQIKITELQTELKKLEYERTALIFEGNRIYYILENNVENQTL